MKEENVEEPTYVKLWASAIQALARREQSAHELRDKLKRRASADRVEELLESLISDGLQSDERFAQMLCRTRFNKGIGPVRIEHELRQHQIACQWIELAMAKYQEHWVDQLQILNQRKYGKTPPVDYPAWAKRARFFQGRGFTHEQIQQAISR